MKKSTKAWLILATCFIFVGLIMFASVMLNFNWDFSKLSTTKYELNSHKINNEFSNISIDTDTADIIFVKSNNEECRVECYEEEKINHLVSVSDDTLFIMINDIRDWYDYIGINFDSPKITVYLPESDYKTLSVSDSTGNINVFKELKFDNIDAVLSTGDINVFSSVSNGVKIKTSTGDINIDSISVGSLELTASTGKITVSAINCDGDINIKTSTGRNNLADIKCKNLYSKSDTGDISLSEVFASEKISITRSTGDVKFYSSDAAEVSVETDTGDVSGTFISEKTFITKTDTGRIEVPQGISGGKCTIKTNTGDIKLNVQ